MILSRSSREQVRSSVRSGFRSRAVILPSNSNSFTMLSVLKTERGGKKRKKERSKLGFRQKPNQCIKTLTCPHVEEKKKDYWFILTFLSQARFCLIDSISSKQLKHYFPHNPTLEQQVLTNEKYLPASRLSFQKRNGISHTSPQKTPQQSGYESLVPL